MIPGRLLGIDHGERRIGLAVCDASGLVAHELTILNRKSRQEDFDRLAQIAAEERVVALVVGLPVNYEAHEGQQDQAKIVSRWANRLQKALGLPLIFWDEQLSSADARELARSKGRKPRDPVDDLAARVILQTYLDAIRDGLTEPPQF
jgi:putative Holliday junction resolvase